jgi:hypothetical protein
MSAEGRRQPTLAERAVSVREALKSTDPDALKRAVIGARNVNSGLEQRINDIREHFVIAFGRDPEEAGAWRIFSGALATSSYALLVDAKEKAAALELSIKAAQHSSEDQLPALVGPLRSALRECILLLPSVDATLGELETHPGRRYRSFLGAVLRAIPGVAGMLIGGLALLGLGKCQDTARDSYTRRNAIIAGSTLLAADAVRASALVPQSQDSAPKKSEPTPLPAAMDSIPALRSEKQYAELLQKLSAITALLGSSQATLARLDSQSRSWGRDPSFAATAALRSAVGLSSADAHMERRLAEPLESDSSQHAWRRQVEGHLSTLEARTLALMLSAVLLLDEASISMREADAAVINLSRLPNTPSAARFRGALRQIVSRESAQAAKIGPSSSEWWVQNYGGMEFVVRLMFATSYVFIGGGLLFLLSQLLTWINAKVTVDRVVEQFAGERGRVFSVVWPLLAPFGIVAALGAGYMSSPKSAESAARGKPQRVVVSLDAEQRKYLDSAFKAISDRVTQVESLTGDIGARAH